MTNTCTDKPIVERRLRLEAINLITNCSTSYVAVGDRVTYNITCNNSSDFTFEDIFIFTNLNPNLKFILQSVKVNNIKRPDLNILSGMSTGKLEVNRKLMISFEAEVISKENSTIEIDTNAECVCDENTEKKSILLNSSCLLYTSPSPRDGLLNRMPSSA